jgi:tryptophan-rich sensory protein
MISKLNKYVYILFPVVLGGLVGILINNYDYYLTLTKPPLSPPKILFPIVWTIIYLLMGISYYIYKREYNEKGDITTYIYYIQLFVNILWTVIFFVFKLKFLSVLWIILLLILLVLLLMKYNEKNKLCTYLNILYLVWVIYATYLTTLIYILN